MGPEPQMLTGQGRGRAPRPGREVDLRLLSLVSAALYRELP